MNILVIISNSHLVHEIIWMFLFLENHIKKYYKIKYWFYFIFVFLIPRWWKNEISRLQNLLENTIKIVSQWLESKIFIYSFDTEQKRFVKTRNGFSVKKFSFNHKYIKIKLCPSLYYFLHGWSYLLYFSICEVLQTWKNSYISHLKVIIDFPLGNSFIWILNNVFIHKRHFYL